MDLKKFMGGTFKSNIRMFMLTDVSYSSPKNKNAVVHLGSILHLAIYSALQLG